MKTARLRLWFLEIFVISVKMKIQRSLILGFIFFFFLLAMVRVRGQPTTQGFISIDCGVADGHNYTDNTNIFYVSDSQYIDTGINSRIASNYIDTTVPIQDLTARSFPVGGRNCYTLKPVVTNRKYLLRATFMYGNYDGLQSAFIAFDLYIGVHLWKTVNISNAATEYQVEVITVASADFLSVCLINTNSGTPFISALELRPIKSAMYPAATGSQSTVLSLRLNYGPRTNRKIRYPDDPYDRIWAPYPAAAGPAGEQWAVISTTSPIKNYVNDSFEAPSAVLQTAVVPAAANATTITFLQWAPDSAADEYFLVFHFSELQPPTGNASRQFGIYVAGSVFWSGRLYMPPTLLSGYVYDPPDGPTYGLPYYAFSLNATWNSTLPPLINAAEVYTRLPLTATATATDCSDVNAIMAIKAQYHVKKNWMGDPCNPTKYVWDGLSCNYAADTSRITFVNLSSSGLTGHIYDSFSTLQAIKYLDLSYNNLTGEIPDFVANLSSLQVLNLTGNNFTGPVPDALLKKADAGLLVLIVDDRPAPCSGISCGNNNTTPCGGISCGKTKIIIVVSVIPAFLLAVVVFTLWIMCRKKQGLGQNVSVTPNLEAVHQQKVDNEERHVHVNIERQQFTYLQLENMTNKFARVIGRGGFGVVYHGYLENGIEVAVKICSLVSSQGTKQFLAEAKSLTHVYHKNLVSLVGYCQDGHKLALIYEYLPLGSLHDHLRGKAGVAKSLNWEVRLLISLQAAQGLDYLHTGCKIVHRDVKSSNILLSENLEAKISDFGLSKVFGDANTSLMSLCGTPGYMDPESSKSLVLNEKSDVYSFGVVLLEIITGEHPILQGQGKENVHIVRSVSKSLATGNINEIVDARLRGEYSVNSAWKVADLAMRCTAETSIERPTMAEVVVQLNESLAMETARARSKNVHGEILDAGQDSAFGFSSVSVGPSAR